jgi:hypothetical protein
MFQHLCHPQGVLHSCLTKLHEFLKFKLLTLHFPKSIKVQSDHKNTS